MTKNLIRLLIAAALASPLMGCYDENTCTKKLVSQPPDTTCAPSASPARSVRPMEKTASGSFNINIDTLSWLYLGNLVPDEISVSRLPRTRGAPGPVMGVGGLPLLAGAYLFFKRRKKKSS